MAALYAKDSFALAHIMERLEREGLILRYLKCEECGRSLGLKMEFCTANHYCRDCLERLIREGWIVSDKDFPAAISAESEKADRAGLTDGPVSISMLK